MRVAAHAVAASRRHARIRFSLPPQPAEGVEAAGKLLFGSAARLSGSSGGVCGPRIFMRPVLECVVDGGSKIDQHAQGLARGVFGVEHQFPGLTDHAQTAGRFLGGELGAAAIDGGDAAALEFAQAVLDGVEVVVDEEEKYE